MAASGTLTATPCSNMPDSSSPARARYTTVRHGGQMALAYAPSAKSAAVLVSLMRFAKWPNRSVCVPRAVIAEDTGLVARQVSTAVRALMRSRAPDPETGEPVPLLELERAGRRGRATSYRLNVANVDACPMGYMFARELSTESATPNEGQEPKGREPIGTELEPIGTELEHDRCGTLCTLKNKRIKKIKEEEEEENASPLEFLRRDQFRAPCRACGGSHVFTLEDSTRGLAHCKAKGRTVTAEVPSGLQVACTVDGYRIEREGAA